MASKNIKGITIEIGGNTTKLQDALKGVNTQVYNLNGDLKALNQALKLDPKNTELLAQKQDVLARNIAATKDKLQTLVEAQKQMGDYNKLTDEQKNSYNQLSLEIAKSKSALEGMNKELKSSSGVDLTGLKDGLKKVGDVAAEVSKKMLQVTAAIGGALAGLVTAGVKSYASLEQNIGGVETLFGAGGKTIEEYAESVGKSVDEVSDEYKVLIRSQELVKENAAKAFETAGVSANEYMEGVTSFSASLLQSLGNDTEKAANVADMAFKDMSDNANKFGTDMSSIQSAYQGFAKQNYTMLDNLKLGYGGTKTEMERLLADAEKISGVKYDISNLSDVYNAIHVIQEEMGVTGTTALEASSTISGSVSSMKAAFDNFLNGSGSPEQLASSITNVLTNITNAISTLAPDILSGVVTLITTVTPQIVSTLFTMLPQLLEAITNLNTSLLTMLTENQDQISETITTLINAVVQFITDNLPTIIQIGITILLALINGIISAIPQLAEQLPTIITTIVNTLIENLPAILNAAIQLLMAIIQAIPTIIQGLVDNLPTIIDTIVTTLIDNLPTLIEASITLFMALIEAIPTIIIALVEAIPTIITSIVDTLWNNKDKILEAGKKILTNLKDGIVNNLETLWTKIKEIPGKIKDKLVEGISKIKDAGKDLINGMWQGIQDKWNELKEKVANFGKGIVDKFKSVFGIASPSKVFKKQIGTNLALGISTGFEETMDKVTKDMEASIPINSLINNVDSAMSGLSYGIEHSINPTINPNISLDQNYLLMAQAMKTALEDTPVILNDREVGKFVTTTIANEIY